VASNTVLLTPINCGHLTTPCLGGVVSMITEPDVILLTNPALFSAQIEIIFGFPTKKNNNRISGKQYMQFNITMSAKLSKVSINISFK
jgi:hypothetical protein